MTSMHMLLVHADHPMQQLCSCLSKQPQAGSYSCRYMQDTLWGILLAGCASCHNAAAIYPLCQLSVLQYNTYCWLHHLTMVQGCILCTDCMLSYNTFLQSSVLPLRLSKSVLVLTEHSCP